MRSVASTARWAVLFSDTGDLLLLTKTPVLHSCFDMARKIRQLIAGLRTAGFQLVPGVVKDPIGSSVILALPVPNSEWKRW